MLESKGREGAKLKDDELHKEHAADMEQPVTLDNINRGDITSYTTSISWSQVGRVIDGEAVGDCCGWAVSLSSDGTKVAVGAPYNYGNGEKGGHVRVFLCSLETDQWVQMGSSIYGEAASDECGTSVSLSSDGMKVAVGASMNGANGEMSGHVRVFSFESGQWIQMGASMNGESAGHRCGWDVSLSSDGMTVAVGAWYKGVFEEESEHVRVFSFVSGQWVQVGANINGEAAEDDFGFSVSLSSDGTKMAVGAPGNADNGNGSGNVRVFSFVDDGKWVQVGDNINGEASGNLSGWSVSLSPDGMTIAVGSPYGDVNGKKCGHVRVFSFTSGQWVQIGSSINGEVVGDKCGISVSLSSSDNGLIVAVCAQYKYSGGNNGKDSGHVRVFSCEAGQWVQVGSNIHSEAAQDNYGSSMSLSSDGGVVAVGAPSWNSGNGKWRGNTRVFKSLC